MNKFRGVRRTTHRHRLPALLLLGLLTYTPFGGAAADPGGHPVTRLHAASILTPHQWCVLDMARDAGARIHLPETMQAIVLVESSAGAYLTNPADPSYGAAGVKLDTAEQVLGRKVTVAELRDDPEVNLAAGSLFLQQCALAFSSWRRTVVCYNRGVAGTRALDDAQVSADFYFLFVRGRMRDLVAYRRHASTCPRD